MTPPECTAGTVDSLEAEVCYNAQQFGHALARMARLPGDPKS